ncbi:MAG: discoidin domain-containing protein, partial [Thomasclavelia spiroformis]|uniref:discoidin domain-containing protein n=1 Tax=Thomasclavelia spiroformis TaxID=29348 RepID=UPI0039A301AC
GDTNTRWATEPRGTNQWIRVDLEEETTFDELVIIPEKGNVQKFKIEVSNDDSTYEMIYDSQTNTSGLDHQSQLISIQ